MVYPSASSPPKLWHLYPVSYSHSWFHPQTNLFSGSILERDKFFHPGKKQSTAQGLVCLCQRTQMWTMPTAAPSAKGTQPCCSTLCVLRCLHIVPKGQLPCLCLQVSRIALLWAVLFLVLKTEEPHTHTHKTNKEYLRAKETLCEPKAMRCSPRTSAQRVPGHSLSQYTKVV